MIPEEQKVYFEKKYKHQDYQKDLYLLFLERYQDFIKETGLIGVIISNTWLQSLTIRKIRSYLVINYEWIKVLLLPEKVFKAVVDTHVVIFRKQVPNPNNIFSIEILRSNNISESHKLLQSEIKSDGDIINISVNQSIKTLYDKILKLNKILSDTCSVYNGIKPFEKGKGIPPQTDKILQEKPYVFEGLKPNEDWQPLLRGSLIGRYTNLWNNNYWILYGKWLAAPRKPYIFECEEKIMIRQTGDSLIATIIQRGYIARNNLHIVIPSSSINLRYLLGLINSKLMDNIYTYLNPEKGEALAEVKKHHVEILPIKVIDNENRNEKTKHDEIVHLVDTMLHINQELQTTKHPDRIEQLKAHIDHTDERINKLVYELYGLTEEEIRIIEGREMKDEAQRVMP
jgi:hypothetical protein